MRDAEKEGERERRRNAGKEQEDDEEEKERAIASVPENGKVKMACVQGNCHMDSLGRGQLSHELIGKTKGEEGRSNL